jgi:hypothetical protein
VLQRFATLLQHLQHHLFIDLISHVVILATLITLTLGCKMNDVALTNELMGVALQTGGAGIGVSGIVYALYIHFTNKFAKLDRDALTKKLVQAERDTENTVKDLERDKASALASAERDKKIEIANMQTQLNKQRLDTHGEFIGMLGSKIDKLTDNVSKLTADVSTVAALQKADH